MRETEKAEFGVHFLQCRCLEKSTLIPVFYGYGEKQKKGTWLIKPSKGSNWVRFTYI